MKSLFSIPKPCHENWDAMTPAEQGRFCSLCAKTVVDFTGMEDAEITIYLKSKKNNSVCGRFTNKQLEEKTSVSIPKKVLYSQTKFVNVFLLALMVTMGSMLFSCKNNDYMTTGEVALIEDTITTAKPEIPARDHPEHTVGIVISPNDSIPPQVEQQPASKSMLEDIKIKPADTSKNK